MEFKLNLAEKKDYDKIAEIYAEEFSKPPYSEPWTKDKAIKKVEIFSIYCAIYSIKIDEKVIGFIVINENQWCPGQVAFGEEMAIESDFQNKGIGTEVFKKVFEIYKKRGYKSFCGMVSRKSMASKLYNKLGMLECKNSYIFEKKL